MNQLRQGIKIELEHKDLNNWMHKYELKHKRLPSDQLVAKFIALEHLKEDKNYYNKLKRARL